MDFLVELIGEIFAGILGETAGSGKVPKVIRTVLYCLICAIPLSVGVAFLLGAFWETTEAVLAVLGGLLIVVTIAALYFLLRKIWKNR